jgi:hypothetical protein
LVADEAIEDSGKIPETAPKGDVADRVKIYIFIVRLLQAFGTFHGAFPCFHSNPNATPMRDYPESSLTGALAAGTGCEH